MTRRLGARLRVQIVASMVLCALLAGGAVGGLTMVQAHAALRDNILRGSQAAADLAAAHTSGYVDDVEASVLTLSARPGLRDTLERGDYAAVDEQLARWLELNPHAGNVSFWDTSLVMRASGVHGASMIGTTCLPECQWRQNLFDSGQAELGDPQLSGASARPIVPFAVPVRARNGRLLGQVSAGISLETLSNTLNSLHVSSTARVSLNDYERGLILANNDSTRILSPATGRNEAANHMLNAERGAIETTNSTGERVLAAYAPVPRLPWGVLIQEPAADAFAPLNSIVANILRLMAAGLLLAMCMGLFFAARLISPLNRLRSTAAAMALGDFSVRASLHRGDEIGDLGEAFDAMAGQLEQTVGELQESEQRKGAMLATALDAVISTDATGHITEFNPAAETMFGYTRDEVLGSVLAEVIVPASSRDAHRAGLARAASGEAGLIGRRIEMTAMRKDGSEFPVELATTAFRIGDALAFTGYLRDITDRKQAEQTLAYQALHDALTGLPNRVLLRDRLQQAVLVGRRDGTGASLLIMDLDRFKEVNDTLGHHAGDLLLQEVASRLRGALRSSDTVARLGGDEFAVVLSGADAGSATAAKLLAALELPFALEGHSVAVGASIGIALFPEHGDDVDNLLRHADVAMYAAKRTRAGFAVYAPEHEEHSLDRLALVAELREALTHDDELVLEYQRKVELGTGTIAGCEALVRWQHPRRGLLGPGQFIDLAEQSGLMRPLTRWVLRTALAQTRAWLEEGIHLPVAVNLSPSSLQAGDLGDEIEELLAVTGVDAAYLEVEITEEAYMAYPERVAATLARLRRLGVRVAIDDFGTGYSSLVYLQKLPVDTLKIDRRFVSAMLDDAGQAAIVRSIVDLGHNLGLDIIAEGVEDEATLARLSAVGCEQAQGFALGRPQPPADLARAVHQQQPISRAA